MSKQQQQDQQSTPKGVANGPTPLRARRRGGSLTPAAREALMTAFLLSFAQTGNVTAAAMKAGINRETVYSWAKTYKGFAERFRQADEQAWDVLRGEAFRRAVQGWDEYVVSMGKIVIGPDGQPLKQRKHSDAVLLAMLKARVPEYRERSEVDIRGDLRHEVTVYELPQKRLMPAPVIVEADAPDEESVDDDPGSIDLPPKRSGR